MEQSQQLIESEERLKIALDTVELGTWEFDPVTAKVYCSERTIQLYGFRPDQIIDLETTLNAIAVSDRERVLHAIQWALNPESGGAFDIEYEVISYTDGINRILKAKGKAFFQNGQAHRFIGTLLDVTSKKKAELEIRASEEQFRLLANTVPQIVWTTDHQLIVEYLNEQWQNYISATAIEGIQSFESFIHPDDRLVYTARKEKGRIEGLPWHVEFVC